MNVKRSGFRLRAAKASDQALILQMVLGARLNPLKLHWGNFILAENNKGMIFGCGQIRTHTDGSRELASIYVIPEKRGDGIARAIIEKLLSDQSGPVWLTCRRALTEFYDRFGFREIKELDSMPIYFRRAKNLMRVLSIGRNENRLAVMCWGRD